MRIFFFATIVTLLFIGFGSCKKSGTDTVKPWIELKGYNPVYSEKGKPYEDAGAIARDVNELGDTINISSYLKVSDNINTDVIGKYSVRYNVSDDAGNKADEVVRTVYIQIFK